jgi:hypothetical protein
VRETYFKTGGDWDSTTLHLNGMEMAAERLYIELRAGRDDWDDEPTGGGIDQGADLTAYVVPSDSPDQPMDLLPGRITCEFPGYTVIIENNHPEVFTDHTRVWLNGRDITNAVVDTVIDINAVDDDVRAYVSEYKDRFILRDELITHTIL